MLKISLLGKTRIERDGQPIHSQMSTKTIALVCWLIMNERNYLSRDKIAACLWPDSSEEAARYNLRYSLWLVKKIIGAGGDGQPFLLSEKDCCGINSQYELSCDLLQVKGFRPGPGDTVEGLLRLKNLFRGEFLEGWYLKNCNEFNEMILFERMVCENKKVEAMRRLAELYEASGQFEEGLKIWKEAAVVEPNNEQFALRVMQGYLRTGNRTGALNYFRHFEAALYSDLGTSPDEELKRFYRELLVKPPCGQAKSREARPGGREPGADGSAGLGRPGEENPGRGGSGRLGSGRLEPGRPESGRLGSGHLESGRLGSGRPGGEELGGRGLQGSRKEALGCGLTEQGRGIPESGRGIRITTCCMSGIDYFWMSDAAKKLVSEMDAARLARVGRGWLLDLGYIQRELAVSCQEVWAAEQAEEKGEDGALEPPPFVPPVRIANAFLRLIRIAAEEGLAIHIKNGERMDLPSLRMLEYIESVEIPGLWIGRG